MNTQVATAAAMLGWLIVEKIQHGTSTTLGAASGAVAGLVAITPACASVIAAGRAVRRPRRRRVCCLAVGLKYKLGFDDSLDVVGVHLVGGILGTLLIGFFATSDGPAHQRRQRPVLRRRLRPAGQAGRRGAGIVLAYSFVVSLHPRLRSSNKTIGLAGPEDAEVEGIDSAEHAETAYDCGGRLARLAVAAPHAAAEHRRPHGRSRQDEEVDA